MHKIQSRKNDSDTKLMVQTTTEIKHKSTTS